MDRSSQGRDVGVLEISSEGWKKSVSLNDGSEAAMSVCTYIPFPPGYSVHGIEQSQADEQTGQSTKSSEKGLDSAHACSERRLSWIRTVFLHAASSRR